MSVQQKDLFFEIECAHESTYDLKELKRLFKRVMRRTGLEYRIFPRYKAIRLSISIPAYITFDILALQQERLEYRGVTLRAIAPDGTTAPIVGTEVTALSVQAPEVSAITIPVSTVITGQHKPIAFPVPKQVEARGTHASRSAA